jgi:hypothetical protein
MPSDIQVTNIKANDGTAGLVIADSTGSVTGTLGSGTTFPAGHQVKCSFNGTNTLGSHLVCDTTSYSDTGLECSHTTALSSTDSYLRFDYYTGMARVAESSTFTMDVTMRTVTNTDYDSEDTIGASSYPMQFNTSATSNYFPLSIRLFCGLVSGMKVPDNKPTWDAGDLLFFRMFAKRGSGTTSTIHSGAGWSITISEIAR